MGVVLVAFTVGSSTAQSPLWLQMKLSVEKETYLLSETIEPRVEIVNRSSAPVYFYSELVFGSPGTLDYLVLDDNGEPVDRYLNIHDGRFMDMDPGAGTRAESSKLRLLDLGESAKGSRPFPVSGLVLGPGSYMLKIKYVVRTELQEHLGIPVWNRRTGPLYASARFTVLPGSSTR
jgi:hypothetical protein